MVIVLTEVEADALQAAAATILSAYQRAMPLPPYLVACRDDLRVARNKVLSGLGKPDDYMLRGGDSVGGES